MENIPFIHCCVHCCGLQMFHVSIEVSLFGFYPYLVVSCQSSLLENISINKLNALAGIPVEGKSSDSECLICMKYRIIIVIIIVISLGQIFYRILQTRHARARTRVHALAIAIRCRPTVTVRSACDNADRWLFK